MWIANGCCGGIVTTFNAIAMRTGYDPTTLTWTDVRDHFLPKRLQNDPGCVKLEFHSREIRLLRITARSGHAWKFRVEDVVLECPDTTSRDCMVKCVAVPDVEHASFELELNDELSLTAALLTIGLHGTLFEIPRNQRGALQYRNAHWDDAAMAPLVPFPTLVPVPPMPEFHPQLVES